MIRSAAPEIPIDVGFYTVPEAARLVHAHTSSVRRWLKGYRFPARGGTASSEPVFQPDLPVLEGRWALTFLDLVELLFIKAFREKGVSLPTIREAAKHASRVWQTSHPFSLKRLYTDGRSVFADVESRTGDEALMDLAKSQYQFSRVISPYLEQLEFNPDGGAARWWPAGKNGRVVISPDVAFGRPVTQEKNIPTEVLYDAYETLESFGEVARWYEVSAATVRAAVRYEKSLNR